MRICFFGDSFVNGTGDDEALGWVGRVVAQARRAGSDVTSYNLGIRRNTSRDIAARWRSEASARLSPEHDGRLVFSFGTNDCAPNGVDGGPRMTRGESLAFAEVILGAAPRWLPTLMIGPGIIAGEPEANQRILALSSDYARLCEKLGVPYFELCHLTASSPVWSREALEGDGAHPNGGGYQLLADAVWAWPAWQRWIAR
jgi:acyl-CoA thioesterase-1